jgi:hypothetical protein
MHKNKIGDLLLGERATAAIIAFALGILTCFALLAALSLAILETTVQVIVRDCDLTPTAQTSILHSYSPVIEFWDTIDSSDVYSLKVKSPETYLSQDAFIMFEYVGMSSLAPSFKTYWSPSLQKQWIVIYPDSFEASPVSPCGIYEVVR